MLWTTQESAPRGKQDRHSSCGECALHVRLDLSEVETFLILKYKTGSEAFLPAVDPETGLPRFVTIREAMAGTSIRCANLEELRRTEEKSKESAESLRTFLLLAAVASGCKMVPPDHE